MRERQNRSGDVSEAIGSGFPVSTDRTPAMPDASCPAQDFCIDSAERANWLVRRIVEARAYRERVRIWAEKEVRRASREERDLLHRFGPQLQGWVTSQIAQSKGRRKSINLPAGTAGFRKIGARLLVDDPAAALDWASQNCPKAVVTRQLLSKSILKDHILATGEVPDVGISLEPVRESFFVR